IAYALGPSGAWLAESKWAIVVAGTGITLGLMLTARRGLALGKWIHNVGGISLIAVFVAMAAFGIPQWIRGNAAHAPLALGLPALSVLNVTILGKVGFGALGGFDTVAVFAGECRAARSIRRSVWIAAPVIAAIFIGGTASVLIFVRPNEVDLISPII